MTLALEEQLVRDYLGPDPMTSPRMQAHIDWHTAPENLAKTGNYGERFLLFHKQMIEEYNAYRATRGFLPVVGWDPATPIPASLPHDEPLTPNGARLTNNPVAVNPGCRTPTWATLAGGSEPDPLYGYRRLAEFEKLDQLGRSIDAGWHGRVHNTIGGDMAMFMSPIDPVFWPWHTWIDQVRASWEVSRALRRPRLILAWTQILFGVVNDGPGIVIPPGSGPVPVPGGPGDPLWKVLSPAARDMMIGMLAAELATLVSNERTGQGLQRSAIAVATQAAQSVSAVRNGVLSTRAAALR